MKRILIIGALLASSVAAQTTQPTRQVEIDVNRAGVTKRIQIILAAAVADRLDANTLTDSDRAAVNVAVELALGHIGETRPNPCHKPLVAGPNLIDQGRFASNCHEVVEGRSR